MTNDENGEEFVEEEVEFDEETVYLMDRLVEEGRFKDESDFVLYALQTKDVEPVESFEAVDPNLDQRIREIKQIRSGTEDETLQEFFLETSYWMQQYGRLAHEAGRETDLSEIEDYMFDDFIYMIGAPNLSGQDADNFLDRTVELFDSFHELSNAANAGYEGCIDGYLDDYFDDMELKPMLMDQ